MPLNKKNSINLFYSFLILHAFVWTLIPALTNNNLPLDTIEALAWGSNLDWGYNKHPPMSAFFVEIIYKIFGPRDWAYYLLSQLFVIFSFFIVFRLGEKIFNNKVLSLLSVLVLEGIYFYNFTTPEFNVNVCQLPFWSLAIYYSWLIYDKKKLCFKDCLLLGLFAGFGFLSKYLFLYLLASVTLIFLYLIFIKKHKKFDFKYLLSFEIFIVLMVPHFIWLFNNDFITITYGIARTGSVDSSIIDHIKYPVIFLFKQVGIIIPFLILIFLLINKFKFNLNLKDKKLFFLLSINFLPIILIFLTSFILGFKIRTMWMTPFYLFFGTLFIYLLKNQINISKLKSFLVGFVILSILSPISYAYVSLFQADKRTDYPGNKIAQKMLKNWNQEFNEDINVVLGDEWHAGNLSYHLNTRPVWDGAIDQNKLDNYNKYICIDKVCLGNK